mmetsp:Transcript_10651/g.29355  ORF Transcript_10651/g.29355 Transcript_10651/m.29355 type:complete len:114 (-) Transcript_10651:373-714(-)
MARTTYNSLHQNMFWVYIDKIFRAKTNNKCMALSTNISTWDDNVEIQDCDGGTNQQWYYDKTNQHIINVSSGECLQVNRSTSNLQTGSCSTDDGRLDQKNYWYGDEIVCKFNS